MIDEAEADEHVDKRNTFSLGSLDTQALRFLESCDVARTSDLHRKRVNGKIKFMAALPVLLSQISCFCRRPPLFSGSRRGSWVVLRAARLNHCGPFDLDLDFFFFKFETDASLFGLLEKEPRMQKRREGRGGDPSACGRNVRLTLLMTRRTSLLIRFP